MFRVEHFAVVCAVLSASASAAFGQSVISAKSGLVHYTEGDVAIDGKAVTDKAGVFADVKKGGELSTDAGRAEVLLTPGVFLRVAEHSAVRMENTALSDTRVAIVSGSSMVEADTPMKDNIVTVEYNGYAVTFLKHGLYEFQTEPAQLKVFLGEAQVTAGGQTVVVKEGRLMAFTAALASERFDSKQGDSLYRWSKTRSEYISVANVSAAKSAGSGWGNGFASTAFGNWFYNPFYGMYTYLPFNGTYYSPFGYAYYSPYTVYQVYRPYGNYGGGSTGWNTNAGRSTHSSVLMGSSNTSNTATVSSTPARGGPSNSGSIGGSIGSGASHAGGHGK